MTANLAARAVLWDLDGTLIDSEELHWTSWRETMAQEGIAITHDQFLARFGQRNEVGLSKWLGEGATPEHVQKIASAKEQRYRELIRSKGISPLPGVVAWVHRLHDEGWLQAVASSAPCENINAVLEALNATKVFQGIVSGDDVRCGKPDPEVYLKAAASVGVPPERCIVVEDAAAGVEGARRAGIRSIGVSHHGIHLSADLVVTSLELLEADAFEKLLTNVHVAAIS